MNFYHIFCQIFQSEDEVHFTLRFIHVVGENDISTNLLTEMRSMQENMRNIMPIPRADQVSNQSGSDDENVPDMVC